MGAWPSPLQSLCPNRTSRPIPEMILEGSKKAPELGDDFLDQIS